MPRTQSSFNTANNQAIGTGIQYDAAGNMTSDGSYNYTYDAEGNITQVTGNTSATYTYNALNQRVQTSANSATTDFVFNAFGQRVSTWNAATQAPIQGQYYWGNTPVAFHKSSAAHFQHQDWMGTERVRTAYNGSVEGIFTSLPFGDDLTTTAGAACRRCGNCDTAKPAKARENCDSRGISRRLSQPQMRRKQGSLCSRSSNCRVWPRL